MSVVSISHAQTLNQNGPLSSVELGKAASLHIDNRAYSKAVELLNSAIRQAESEAPRSLLILLHNDLGRAYAGLGESSLAAKHYRQAMTIAGAEQQYDLLLVSQFNLLVTDRSGLTENRRLDYYAKAKALIKNDSGHAVTGLQYGLLAINDYEETGNQKFYPLADWFLQAAITRSENAALEENLKSEALGQLGKLYRLDQKFDQAIVYSHLAIDAAEKSQNLEQLYRWYWQMAGIKTATNNITDALSYYHLAVAAHQKTFVTAVSQDSIGPENKLYHNYLSLLLKQAESGQQQDNYYALAIRLIEKLRTAEVQDYFKHRCVADSRVEVSNVNELIENRSAVLYPVMVDDRLEVLLVTSEKIYHASSELSSVTLQNRISKFRSRLESLVDDEYLIQAASLYDDMLRPFEKVIKRLNINQLIVVPDLLTAAIPFPALFDGKQFIIEKLNLSVAPSVELTRSSKFSGQSSRALYAGISLPLLNLPALQQVKQEIKTSRQYIPGDVLLNRQFSASQVSSMVENGLYNILHIASHSKIADDVGSSYVVTYDGQINLDGLQNMVSKVQFSNSPIDLLTLSACSTAVGDPRAALGFAGLAVKSGARSVLASLWSIDDTATAKLVTEFYRVLSSGSYNKVESIRKAQLTMLHDVRYQHPGYWAAFTLIGDWK